MMTQYTKVSNAESLVRDMTTGAILNNNVSGYESYIAQRNRLKEQKERAARQEENINNLSKEISELKDLVNKLLLTAMINKASNKDIAENNNG